jgi:hypothetical protein
VLAEDEPGDQGGNGCVEGTTGIGEQAGGVAAPPAIDLELRVEPNPFHGATSIAYRLARAGAAVLDVYDVSGRHVRTLAFEPQAAGGHEATWDGRDAAGRDVPSGAYLVRLRSPEGERSARAVLLR